MPDLKQEMKTPMTAFSLGSGADASVSSGVEKDSQGDLEQRVADLESRPRMPAQGTGNDGDALVLDGPSPRWGSGLPPITASDKENMVLALIDIGGGELEAQWSYLKLT